MVHPKKEQTVMTRIRITDHKFVKQLADSENLSISDKLSEIIRQWHADQAKKYSDSSNLWRA